MELGKIFSMRIDSAVLDHDDPDKVDNNEKDTEAGIVGGSPLDSFISSYPVVVISKTTCPFCIGG